MNSKIIFWSFISAWIIVWLIFIVKEDKKGDYSLLRYLYTHDDTEKRRHVIGEQLYDFIVFCKMNLPESATYDYNIDIPGRGDIARIYTRYLLYPLKRTGPGADFKIYYFSKPANDPGYVLFRAFGETGIIFKKEQNSGRFY